MAENTELNVSKGQDRIGYFDVLRGMTMILVVYAHVQLGLKCYETPLVTAMGLFRMPLFFFVSGFFAYRTLDKWTGKLIKSVLKRKIQAQIVGTLFFFGLYQLLVGGDFFEWTSEGFGGFWFTITLFQIFVVYIFWSCLAKLFRKEWIFVVGMIGCSLFRYAAGYIFNSVYDPTESTLWVILSQDKVIYYFQFFTVGIFCRKYQSAFTDLLSKDWFMTASILCYIGFLILYFHEGFKTSYGTLYSFVQSFFVRVSGLFMVVGYVFSKRDFFNRNNKISNLLRYIGGRTLDIYLIHYLFIPGLLYDKLSFMTEYLMPNNMIFAQITVGMLISAIIIALCLGISSVLRSSHFLSQWLFGVK